MSRQGLPLLTTALLASSLLGCAADLGINGGYVPSSQHRVLSGRLAGTTRLGTPINEQGLLVGLSLENRAEEDVGSRWTTGLMAGWGSGPSFVGGRVGGDLFVEFGSPFRPTLFENGDRYLGIGGDLPISLDVRRKLTDLNERTWILRRRLEIVPMLRGRWYTDHDARNEAATRFEISGGLSFRLRVATDLF